MISWPPQSTTQERLCERGCIFFACLSCLAQTNQQSWATLSALQPGQNIQIIDTSSKKHSGTFMSVSDSAVSLQGATGQQSIPQQEIRSVKLIGSPRRARNALIGGAVGGGLGASIGAIAGAASHNSCNGDAAFCLDFIGTGGSAAIGAGFGFVAGAIVGGTAGALIPHRTTILFDTRKH